MAAVGMPARSRVEPVESSELDIECAVFENLGDALESLLEREFDHLAVFATDLEGPMPDGVDIIGALPVRNVGSVLVSDDRPEHLPRRARILCDRPLVKRQLRRFRHDLSIRNTDDFAQKNGLEGPPSKKNELLKWGLKQIDSGLVDGIVVDREIWEAQGGRRRRHRLGLEVGANNDGRFLAHPYSGITLILARSGELADECPLTLDDDAAISWDVQKTIWPTIHQRLRPHIGMRVDLRRPGSLLKERPEDQILRDELVNPSGKIKTGGRRIEIEIEYIGRGGLRSFGISRLSPVAEAAFVGRLMVREWKEACDIWMAEVPDDPRHGPASAAFIQ